jgi:hypothetical protein
MQGVGGRVTEQSDRGNLVSLSVAGGLRE